MQYSEIITADSLNATDVLMVPHKTTLTGVNVQNGEEAVSFVMLYDAAAVGDVTVGTTIPDWVVTVPASSVATDTLPSDGVVFELGIVAASLTTVLGNTGASQHVRITVA